MYKYKQMTPPHSEHFLYEYWIATHRDIYGARIMKVRISPTGGPCGGWPKEFYNVDGGEDKCLYSESNLDDWLWISMVMMPDSRSVEQLKKDLE